MTDAGCFAVFCIAVAAVLILGPGCRPQLQHVLEKAKVAGGDAICFTIKRDHGDLKKGDEFCIYIEEKK